MNTPTNSDDFKYDSQEIRDDVTNSETKEEIEFEIKNLKNEYQFLLKKNEELDNSFELIKEKYLQESKRLKWHIKTNEEAILALQMTTQSAISNSPMDESKTLQTEINQLNEDIARLKENENNLSLSQTIVSQEIDEIEFLIESIPFDHENLFKLAEQKMQHQLNKEIIDIQISSSEIENKKESLQIELNIAQSILSKWQFDNESFSQKIWSLKQKRKDINQKINEIKQSNNLNFHTIQYTKLQNKLDQINKEKESELQSLNYNFESRIRKIENQASITQLEINERLNAIEILNKKNIDLTAEYENAKDNFKIKINQLKERQLNEIDDIKKRFQIEFDKILSNQKEQFSFSIDNFEFSSALST